MLGEIIPFQKEIHALPPSWAWEGEESHAMGDPSLWPPWLLVLLTGQESYCSAGQGENPPRFTFYGWPHRYLDKKLFQMKVRNWVNP